jgi:hypothetical protein
MDIKDNELCTVARKSSSDSIEGGVQSNLFIAFFLWISETIFKKMNGIMQAGLQAKKAEQMLYVSAGNSDPSGLLSKRL